MRIVQLIMARQFRGAELSAYQLSLELLKRGHTVLLVSLYHYNAKQFAPAGVEWVDLGMKKRGAFDFRVLIKLMKLLHSFKPDIVQANAGDTLKYAALLKMIPGIRFKLIFRNASTMSQYLKSNIHRLLQLQFLKRANHITSVSQLSKADLISVYPVLKKNITVIPAGVNGAFHSDQALPEDLKALFASRKVFIHVGGFTFEKNHAGLINIFKTFLIHNPTAVLLLIGEGPLFDKTVDSVRKEKIEGSVIFLGNRSDVMNILPHGTALLLPSVIEGLPSVILEAFACRLPVIAYDVGGISEVVNKPTGWLIKKGDEISFVNAMQTVAKGGEARDQITRNAFQLVNDKYTNAEIASRFIVVYQTVLNE